jgi:hypothetical protein
LIRRHVKPVEAQESYPLARKRNGTRDEEELFLDCFRHAGSDIMLCYNNAASHYVMNQAMVRTASCKGTVRVSMKVLAHLVPEALW